MVSYFYVILGILLAGCSTVVSAPPEKSLTPHTFPKLYALEGYQIYLHHVAVSSEIGLGTSVEAGQPLGTVQEGPSRLSEKYHEAIITARELSNEKRYSDALEVIGLAVHGEPTNPFVLEIYARTLFWLNQRSRSFEIYQQLIETIETGVSRSNATILVDVWFIDAYWKLGILHLDRGEYAKAAFEISRAFAGGLGRGQREAAELALGYLTEAYFHLGNRRVARYYADQTLQLNPKNQYVLKYIDQL
jgi:tetratricopeptide (TPR) repeat protein